MTKDEIKALEARIQKERHNYYNGTPKIKDSVYDKLEDQLRAVKPNSPVLRKVGAAVVGADVKLPYAILSLDKIKENAEAWLERNPGPYVIMDKLDGYSMENVCDGKAWQVFTRGDGYYGKDKSFMADALKLPDPKRVGSMGVRAEALISKTRFKSMADKYEDYGGKKPFENERNAVGSAINRGASNQNPKMVGAIKMVAYEVLSHTQEWKPSVQLKKLKALGFETVWHEVHKVLDAETLSAVLKERKAKSPYLIDGIVVIIDKPYRRATVTNPKYAVAFKEHAEEEFKDVEVERIEWQPSAHGVLKPVIIIKEMSDEAKSRLRKATR